jgi:senataxin
VKKQYKDVDDYINTYEPLIFEEAKAQIIRGKEEDNGIFFSLFLFAFFKFF